MDAPNTHPDLAELQRTLTDLNAHLNAGPEHGYQAARCADTIAAQARAVADRARRAAATHATHLRSVS